MNKAYYKPTEKTTWKKLNDKVIIVDIESGAYYSLNDTASGIWQRLMENKSTTDVLNEMSIVYEINRDILETDMTITISDWEKSELIIKYFN